MTPPRDRKAWFEWVESDWITLTTDSKGRPVAAYPTTMGPDRKERPAVKKPGFYPDYPYSPRHMDKELVPWFREIQRYMVNDYTSGRIGVLRIQAVLNWMEYVNQKLELGMTLVVDGKAETSRLLRITPTYDPDDDLVALAGEALNTCRFWYHGDHGKDIHQTIVNALTFSLRQLGVNVNETE